MNDPRDGVIQKYQAISSSHFGGHAHDAFIALVTAFEKANEQSRSITRQDIRDALEGIKNMHGVTGTFSFSATDHAGLGIEAFETYKIENGKFVPLIREQ